MFILINLIYKVGDLKQNKTIVGKEVVVIYFDQEELLAILLMSGECVFVCT